MEITNPKIETYMNSLLENRAQIYKEIEGYAKDIDFPIIEPLVGKLLNQYAHLIKAKRILELGSGFGYSAIWFSDGLNEETEIICTDLDEQNKTLAEKYFKEAEIKTKIDFRIGDALEILENLEGEYDIIFNDVEKEDYPEAYEKSVLKLKKGGLLITDNTLWYGKIIENNMNDLQTSGVKEYNKLAFSDIRVKSVILPIRDGITVSLKV